MTEINLMHYNKYTLIKMYKELEEENERLSVELNQNMIERNNYLSRNEKAIEYYKAHQQECVIGRNKDDKLIRDYYLPAQCSKVLLNILQEKDK